MTTQTRERASITITPVSLMHSTCYLMNIEEGYLLVDTGLPGTLGKFTGKLKKIGVDMSQIKYIFITHHHSDHVGLVNDIQVESNARLILHKNAVKYLKRGVSVVGKPANFIAAVMSKIFSLLGNSSYPPIIPKDNDIIIDGDDDRVLRDLGIEAKILYTPGHTDDSISILLDDGTLIGGDAPNPLFIENAAEVERSLKKMLEEGTKRILPTHGPPFDAEKIREKFRRK